MCLASVNFSMFLQFIHAGACISNLFSLLAKRYSIIWAHCILFIHQLVDSQVVSTEAIMNNVANNIHVSLFTFLNSVTFPPRMEAKFSIRCVLFPCSFSLPIRTVEFPQMATKVAINVLINSLGGFNSPEKKRLANLIRVFYSRMAYEKLLAKCPPSS